MDNSTAATYAKYGAGRIPHLAQLSRSIKELEVSLSCTLVALHITGRRNAVSGALSRFTIRARGRDPYPRRELRPKYRREVVERRGPINCDMLARDDGSNAWGPSYRSPANAAFEGPLPPGQLRRFPSVDTIELAPARALACMKEEWPGSHLRLLLLKTRRPRFPKLAVFERRISWPANLSLFLDHIEGSPQAMQDEEKTAWAVSRLRSCA